MAGSTSCRVFLKINGGQGRSRYVWNHVIYQVAGREVGGTGPSAEELEMMDGIDPANAAQINTRNRKEGQLPADAA